MRTEDICDIEKQTVLARTLGYLSVSNTIICLRGAHPLNYNYNLNKSRLPTVIARVFAAPPRTQPRITIMIFTKGLTKNGKVTGATL